MGEQVEYKTVGKTGYLVTFRIVKRHHDHRSLTVYVQATDAEDAKDVAERKLTSAAQSVVPGWEPSHDTNIGYIKVERVTQADPEFTKSEIEALLLRAHADYADATGSADTPVQTAVTKLRRSLEAQAKRPARSPRGDQ